MKEQQSELIILTDHGNRITALEVNWRNINETVKEIDKKVDCIMESHLPGLKMDLSQQKWTVGIIVGTASAIGAFLLNNIGYLLKFL